MEPYNLRTGRAQLIVFLGRTEGGKMDKLLWEQGHEMGFSVKTSRKRWRRAVRDYIGSADEVNAILHASTQKDGRLKWICE